MASGGHDRAVHAGAAILFLIASLFAAAPARAGFGVQPFADCVTFDEFTNQIIVYWGYDNTNVYDTTVENAFNFFVPGPSNRDQPITFAVGVHHHAFTTVSDASASITWVLGEFYFTAQNDPSTYCNSGYPGFPTAQAQSLVTNRDTPLPITLMGSDSVAGPVGFSISSLPAHGTLSGSGSSYTYTPAPGYVGGDSFQYAAVDGFNTSLDVTVTITVLAVNRAPIAFPDGYSTAEEVALTVAAPGVLANDSDPDGDHVSIAAIGSPPAHGTLTLQPDGSFVYAPAPLFHGSDSFTYIATDGVLGSSAATVTINVAPVNHSPSASSAAINTNENTSVAVNLVASDADGNTLSYSVGTPSHGSLTGTPPSLTYAPASNYSGADSFTFKVNDGTIDSNLATVSIAVAAVDQRPVANADSYGATEEVPLTVAAPGVLGNDADPDSATITAALSTAPAHGSVTLNANGSFTYTPAPLFHGTDSFTYAANDGTLTSTPATVTINIAPVNHPPSASSAAINTSENTSVPVNLVATDVDGNALAYSVGTPLHGIITGTPPALTYAPAANYNGADSFTFKVNDGTVDSNTATVAIAVAPVDQRPVANADSYGASEETPLTVAAPGVLANDTDADSPAITAALASAPGHGTLTLNPNGSFTYAPAALFHGTDSFTYAANDGTLTSAPATVTINVAAVNHAPIAAASSVSTSENTPVAVTPVASDPDGDGVSINITRAPSHGHIGGSSFNLTYTPDSFFHGADSFSFVANDGKVSSTEATITIDVAFVNHPPVATADTYSVTASSLTVSAPGVLSNDSDPDGDAITARVIQAPSNGTLDLHADGSFTYTPATLPIETSFVYAVCDGSGLCTNATATLTSAGAGPVAIVSGDVTICANGTAVISLTLAGRAPWSVTWSDGLTQTYGSSSATRSVQPAATTIYSITSVSDATGSGHAYGSAHIEVDGPPPAPAISGTLTVPDGSVLQLEATAGYDHYQWLFQGSAIDGATGQTYIKPGVSASDTGTYSVIAYRGACGSATASVNVSLEAPRRLILPVIGSGSGAFGSLFRTRLQIENPTSDVLHGSIRVRPAGTVQSDSDASLPFTIAPGQVAKFDDLMAGIGAIGTGDLLVDNGVVPPAVVTVLNDAGAAGTTSASYAPIDDATALRPGSTAVLLAPEDPSTARFNIGVRALDSGATIRFTLRHGDGSAAATITSTYGNGVLDQRSASDLFGTAITGGDSVEITVLDGAAIVYGTTTDNRTNDPSIQFAR